MDGDFFSYKDGKIYYEIEGAGEAIVFLHGFTLDHTMWDSQVKFFSSNYRVITFDMRGFGKSSLPVTQYSYIDDLHALLNNLKVTSAHIVGLSLGGEEALNFALKYPEYVKSLTLVSSSLSGYPSTVDWDVKAKEFGLEAAKQNWLNHAVFQSSKKYPEVLTRLKIMLDNYTGWHWLNSGYRIKPTVPSIDRLGDLSVRTLVVTGKLDLDYYHKIAQIFLENIKDVRVMNFDECGHMLTMEDPQKFNEILSGFLGSNK